MRFHIKATASSRSTSTPLLARWRTTSRIARNTSGLAQFRSHWNSLNVVQTHFPAGPISGQKVKEPGAWSGKISTSVRSKARGVASSSNIR